MPCRVNAYNLKVIRWLLGDWCWKTTPDVLDQDDQSLGVWDRAKDRFDGFKEGQHKIHKQDAATKRNPEHSLLDLTGICALAKLMQGPG